MKKHLYLWLIILSFNCNSEDAADCFQTRGTTVQQQIDVPEFTKILDNKNIQLIVKQGAQTQVVVETGENLISDVEVEVVAGKLIVTDNNTCNYVRHYTATKVYVTAPNLTEIRSSTQHEITSDGTLTYNNITLLSEDFNHPESFTVGDFNMQFNNSHIRVVSNNIASFYFSGLTENLSVEFYSGAGRFQGENLIAQKVTVFHRGSNDMVVNPQEELNGELRGTGNLIVVNQPPILDVEQFYTGQVIFN